MTGKPLPSVTAESRPYWDACEQGRLVYQYCPNCAKAQFPPGIFCRTCAGSTLSWRESALSGAIHSVTVVHRAPSPAFRQDVPYSLALVDLDEGFRLMLRIRGANHLDARIGDRIRVEFEKIEDGFTLPQAVLGDDPGSGRITANP